MEHRDLAKASGLTVRTRYHHDEIGLVVASERTTSGHRRYTPDEVRRLYQVKSLRQRGLSLEEVRTALSSPDSLRPIFQARLAAVRRPLPGEFAETANWRMGSASAR